MLLNVLNMLLTLYGNLKPGMETFRPYCELGNGVLKENMDRLGNLKIYAVALLRLLLHEIHFCQ